MSVSVTFLGVGDASQTGLGHASICISLVDNSRLLVDCGPGVLQSFMTTYECLPDALFITHCHLDHIADFEKLFIKCWFHSPKKHRPKIFVPASIIPLLHERIGTYPGALAEGGVNFWEAFQLIPVSDVFEFGERTFRVFPARHHGVNSAFSLYLSENFYYTGDTRPIPEILENEIDSQSIIFHDCSLVGNPSHTGVEDLQKEYSVETQKRLFLYHYNSASEQAEFESKGFTCVSPGQMFTF